MKNFFTSSLIVTSLSFSAVSFGNPLRDNIQERTVQQLAVAYFSGQDVASTERALAATLDPNDADVQSVLKSLADALAKLQADGEKGLLRFKERDYVVFARTIAFSDVAIARSSLTRIQTALASHTLSAQTKDLLANLATQLAELNKGMGGQ